MLEYQLIRSKRRKTLSLQVRHGQVTVRAPYYVAATLIDTFIKEKSAWLHTKVAEQKKKPDFCDFSQGSSLFFLGEHLTLNICLAKKSNVFIDNSIANEVELFCASKPSLRQLNVVINERVSIRLIEPLDKAARVKKLLETYFKQQAEQLIIERLEFLSTQTSLSPTKVNIRQYRARWGSCNNRGELSFNYLLVMAPIFVIDYVIIHELCHLVHLNHSKDFWQLVEKFCPNVNTAKKWLNIHQSQLHWKNPT
ncbi:M48 family metallopeptidase [Colwellia sp. 12G3]|uniref:M48 family metallopeptidase n=1 Tax=Colwellia sp. 12G3 TaxID=2058299 RepID=UPI000C34EBFC|nr:SprT family zinc-dependent metalloprotease [Colwellia sp. 12G3]PKI12922.1 M48 family peptidase [Colwellia sp. 12G3]